ncbi:MAG: TOMM precursor leader peptide-binding protein [Anaerolineae bacterium]|nr:TOMM precursor leader peptide-binding protein [Anaerolineae bacterium]
MSAKPQLYYRLSPGIDIVPLRDNEMLFRSDTVAIRLGGESSLFFVEQIVPLLDGQRSFDQLAAALPTVSPETLQSYLDQLVQLQVLQSLDKPQTAVSIAEQALTPFLTILNTLGLPLSAAMQKLRDMHIAVVGLEGHGAHIAAILGQCGVGRLTLVDPFPCRPGNLTLMPGANADAIGLPRQQIIKTLLDSQPNTPEVITAETQNVTLETVTTLATACDFLVGCFDRGFLSANQWLNQAAVKLGIPAIYAEAAGHIGWVGPLVIPQQTACYTCFRRRRLATSNNLAEAVAYETYLSEHQQPALHNRGVLPALMPHLASSVVLEMLKHLLSLGRPTLIGQVMAFNALTLQTKLHPVLQKPDCPVCHSSAVWSRYHPSLAELENVSAGDLLAVAAQLVDLETGVVKTLAPISSNDKSEPLYLFHAELANHRFLDEEDQRVLHGLGKGLTAQSAQASALGEAIESYAGLCWSYDEVIYAQRNRLDGASLDPRRLGLYHPSQYDEQLPYVPYDDENRMGWVKAYSLVSGSEVYIPALAVFMTYKPQQPHESICPTTSNGLATAPTPAEAILRAALEVVERDAFIITWLNRLPGRHIDISDHPDPKLVELCEFYWQQQVTIHVIQLPTDQPCFVFMALAVQRDGSGPAGVVGLGADIDPARAARQAVLETVQTRAGVQSAMHKPEMEQHISRLVREPHHVTAMADHALRYADPAALSAFDFLLHQPLVSMDWKARKVIGKGESMASLQALVTFYRSQRQDLITYNLTPPDMAKLGLHTARVVLPGLQPIYFGRQARRLACPRLYELPRQLGFTESSTTVDHLNDDPHPFS